MSFNAAFDHDPEGYERLRRCWLNTRRRMFLQDWLQRLNLAAGARVLELGSGTGWLLRDLAREFASLQFVGAEPIPAYVSYATAQSPLPNLRFVCARAEGLSREVPGPFQAILSNDVLHHVESVEDSVRSAAALGAPECRWMAIEPNPRNPYAFCGQALKTGERNFRVRAFLRCGAAEGWRLVAQRYLFAIPPFVREAPAWARALELQVETFSVVGGGISLDCQLHK